MTIEQQAVRIRPRWIIGGILGVVLVALSTLWLVGENVWDSPGTSAHDHSPNTPSNRGVLLTQDMAGMPVSAVYAKTQFVPDGQYHDGKMFHIVEMQSTAGLSLDRMIIGPVCASALSPELTDVWIGVYPAGTVDPQQLHTEAETASGIKFNQPLRERVPQCNGTVLGVGYNSV